MPPGLLRAVDQVCHTIDRHYDMSTDYSPFLGRVDRTPAKLELVRVLRTMRSTVGKEITAAIYAVATGRELRVSLGPELLESHLSRGGDGPLEARADELSALLVSKGWAVPRNEQAQ